MDLKTPEMIEDEIEAAPGDAISQLVAASDDDLLEFTGAKQRLQEIRNELTEADKLKGEARKKASATLAARIAPRLDSWDIKDAIRSAQPKKDKYGPEGICCE